MQSGSAPTEVLPLSFIYRYKKRDSTSECKVSVGCPKRFELSTSGTTIQRSTN